MDGIISSVNRLVFSVVVGIVRASPEIGAMWPSGGGATTHMSSGCGGLPLTFDAM